MKSIRTLLDKILKFINVVSLAFLTALVTWQVITRYFLNHPSTWSEELSGYMFAWVTIFGAAYVFGQREHMNIPILLERVSVETKWILNIITELVILSLSAGVLIYGGVRITILTMGQMSSSLGLPMGYFYSCIPISGCLIVIYNILNLLDITYKLK